MPHTRPLALGAPELPPAARRADAWTAPASHRPSLTATALFCRGLRRDPLARLLAIATRHAGRGLPLSARSALSEGLYLLEHGESPWHARRSILRAVELRIGAAHPDYHCACALVRAIDAADAAALGVAA